MECQGEFVFKTLTYRPAGKMIDTKGNEINYSGAYKLKVDQLGDDGSINERVFVIKEDQTVLINDLKQLNSYEKIVLTFNLTFYSTKVVLSVKDVSIADTDI